MPGTRFVFVDAGFDADIRSLGCRYPGSIAPYYFGLQPEDKYADNGRRAGQGMGDDGEA